MAETRDDSVGRPLWPETESRRRRAAVIVLGGVLIVSFLLPAGVTTESQDGRPVSVLFALSIRALGEPAVPGVLKVALLYPLLAGVTVIVLALGRRVAVRAVGLVVLGVAGLLLPLMSSDIRAYLDQGPWGPGGAGALVILAAALGWLGIFAGSRSRWYRPSHGITWVVGLVGAGLLLAALFWPGLPAERGYVLIAAPVVMMGQSGGGWPGLAAFLQVDCLLVAALLCLAAHPRQPLFRVRRLAAWAFLLVVTGIVIGCFAFLSTLTGAVPMPVTQKPVELHVVTLVKILTWGLGLVLLVPFGITDWLVGDPFPSQHQPVGSKGDGHGAASK